MEDKQNTSVKNASEEAFDVTGFFLECISYWKWFVASVVVLAVAVMFYCFRQTPVYEVTSAVYIQDNKGDNSNILLENTESVSNINIITKLITGPVYRVRM